MSEKLKGMFGSKTRADEVLAWLKNQGAEECAFDGDAEGCIYFVDQGQVKIVSEKLAVLLDIVELPRWRAEEGKKYYFVNYLGEVDFDIDHRTDVDNVAYAIGNYFQTKGEAEKYARNFVNY